MTDNITMALLALRHNADRLLSFNIRNDEYLPSTALPVFRSPEHAVDFRDSVLRFVDTRSLLWTVSVCRRTNEVTFETCVRRKQLNRELTRVRPKDFDVVNDTWLIDELIARDIGCIVVDSYNLSHQDRLLMYGSIWIPNKSVELI